MILFVKYCYRDYVYSKYKLGNYGWKMAVIIQIVSINYDLRRYIK